MPSLDSTLLYAAGGALVGTGIYLYSKGYLDDLLPDIITTPPDGEPEPIPNPSPNPAPVPGTSGTYAYWAKKKIQCRDNHLTFGFLAGYGVKILNWKLYNDNKIYTAMCGAPGPLTILVAIDAADTGSAGKLSSLGFTQYFAPPTDPNPNVPIPNPPSSSNYAMTMAYVGQGPQHRAYKVFRHYRDRYARR